LRAVLLIIIISLFSIFYVNGQIEVTISEVQGTGTFSPFNNDLVSLTNVVVTAVNDGFFFAQSTITDNSPNTSEGIIVFHQGDEDFEINEVINVTGQVREFDNNTTISASSIFKTGQTNTTLTPIQIDDAFPGNQRRDIHPLEFVEGQLVQFTNLNIVGPSPNGSFAYASASAQRPMREPGIEFPAPNGLPEWDGNPEIFDFVPIGLGLAANPFLNANMKVSGTGIIVEGDFRYGLFPISYTISDEADIPTVPLPNSNEFNVACLNTLFLDNEEGDYDVRLEKITQYIITQLGTPDVIALQEVRGEEEFVDLATSLKAATGIEYNVHTDDATGFLNNGYLSQNTFTVQSVEAQATNFSFQGGALHDRAPLLLEGQINTAAGTTPLSILNLHIRSLNDIETDFVQEKRNAQARSIANMVKNLQDEGKQFLVVGDFNAFPFTDGYVDVLSQISGTPTLGALFPPLNIGIDPPLTNISTTFIPVEQQYSFVFRGSAQILDHCLASAFDDFEVSHFHYGRGNCDYPESLLSTDNPFRASDHDGFSVYLDLNEEVVESVGGNITSTDLEVLIPNPYTAASVIQFDLDQKQNIQIDLFNLAGQLIYSTQIGAIEKDRVDLPFTEQLTTGYYIIQVSGSAVNFTDKLLLVR